MSMLKRAWDSPYCFWAILAIPSIPLLAGALGGNDLEPLLHPSGEQSARMMILAMMLTPLRLIWPGARWLQWLLKRRRYLGVAAFGYAVLHTLYYLIDLGSLSAILADAVKLGIWTGWLAFVIFVPLAATSNNAAVRWLKDRWKPLQRFVYAAAVATLLHWIFVHNNLGPALVHFVPLAALEAYRVWHNLRDRDVRATGSA